MWAIPKSIFLLSINILPLQTTHSTTEKKVFVKIFRILNFTYTDVDYTNCQRRIKNQTRKFYSHENVTT